MRVAVRGIRMWCATTLSFACCRLRFELGVSSLRVARDTGGGRTRHRHPHSGRQGAKTGCSVKSGFWSERLPVDVRWCVWGGLVGEGKWGSGGVWGDVVGFRA